MCCWLLALLLYRFFPCCPARPTAHASFTVSVIAIDRLSVTITLDAEPLMAGP